MLCRALTMADYADASALYAVLSSGETLPEFETGKGAFRNILDHTGTRIIGAQVADHIVSMATLHILPNMTYGARPYALIENVATLPAHQAQGFGRAVMETVIASAWEKNVYKIMLLTGQANGVSGFYQALGFDGAEKNAMILRAPHSS